MSHFFLYGPPGAGKSTLGALLAEALEMPFHDLDMEIAAQAGRSIAEIFAEEGEVGFRAREYVALRAVVGSLPLVGQPPAVIALGGGALLDERARALAEGRGKVLVLRAGRETIAARLQGGLAPGAVRPLLSGEGDPLARLLEARAAHYNSFSLQLSTDGLEPQALLWKAMACLGAFRARGMGAGYDLRLRASSAEALSGLDGLLAERGLRGPLAVISDSNVGPRYGVRLVDHLRAAGLSAELFCIPAGEANKTIATVQAVWDFLLRVGMERGGTVMALGGGVVGDLTGFAAATYLRGVAWVNLPTTLLAMVDSSLGGKTGVDLPQAKNLVGAFHPPRLVLSDLTTLETLPEREWRGGMAEVLKHGVIGDAELFARCAGGWQAVRADVPGLVAQAVAVKLRVIEADPYEQGLRQALNLGHTIGHGLEQASEFRLSHGEAVSIGMVLEARLAEQLGLAETGLASRIRAALMALGLPVTVPVGVPLPRVLEAMAHDKKRAASALRFALPVRVGEVRPGVSVENWRERVLRLLEAAQ